MKPHQPTSAVPKFTEFAFEPSTVAALERLKLVKPTVVQSQAIPLALGGADFIAVAQTGSGKTLAYALPIVTALLKSEHARALVLAPSREMAQQIHLVFQELCVDTTLTCGLVIGGLPGAKQSSQLRKNPKIVVATPGRMNDHLVTNKLLLKGVEIVVVDEADRMMDLGFAPQLKNVQATLRGSRQTLMFSATFDPAVETVAKMFLKPEAVMIRAGTTEGPVGSLRQKVLLLERNQKNDRLLDELNATKTGVIVFTADKERCETVGQYLKEYGYKTDLIHGELSHGHRNRVLREFRNGDLRVIVATDLLARGIDVPHVDHVINFDFPFDPGDFIHRIGRTARAGKVGYAVTFVTPSDERRYQKALPFLTGAETITLDPNFEFYRGGRKDRYQSKSKLPPPRADLKTGASRGKVPRTIPVKNPGRPPGYDQPRDAQRPPPVGGGTGRPAARLATSRGPARPANPRTIARAGAGAARPAVARPTGARPVAARPGGSRPGAPSPFKRADGPRPFARPGSRPAARPAGKPGRAPKRG